jgi:hypothetical protein
MPASNYLVGKLLDHKNGVASYTAPATRSLQLDTTKYGADGAGGVAVRVPIGQLTEQFPTT